MKIGSLFSGIGGLELGLEMAGVGRTIWQAESDPFCLRVLEQHWPDAIRLRDVRNVSPVSVSRADLICGGFPCQDVSVAGKGAGLDGARSGLWFEFARVVEECDPAWVVVENVSRGRSRWLPAVCEDLERLGYVPAPVSLPAGTVGAPHERARTFVVADPDGLFLRLLEQREPARSPRAVRDEGQGVAVDDGGARNPSGASAWAALPDLHRMDDGFPAGMDPRSDRADRTRTLGNAVVPQVAAALGRAILAAMGAT